MEWNMMEPIGVAYTLGDLVDDVYIPSDECEEILEEMIDALLNEDKTNLDVRRRMSLEKVVEKDLVPLLKVCNDEEVFGKIVRLMANLTQPLDMCIYTPYINDTYCNEVNDLISTTKNQCTDLDFFKALSANMKEILKKDVLEPSDCQYLNHSLLLLRNLLHMKPGASNGHQAVLAHQCLISSFFINELDKVIYTMLNHKHKEMWTIAMAQLLSFIFKEHSASLLEPDIDDNTSAASSDENQDVLEFLCPSTSSGPVGCSSDKNLSNNFKSKLQIQSSPSDNSSQASDDDDFMLEFKSTPDGKLEIKLTSCLQKTNGPRAARGEDMDVGDGAMKCSPDSSSKLSSKNFKGSNSSINSDRSFSGGEVKNRCVYSHGAEENEVLSSINQSSCLMDTDILISYLKKFATEIMYSGFVDLVENILKALLSKYDNILDHSFLMWTVGFFLSFAHQQEVDFVNFKEVLNLDLFGFLVYEGIKCCEALAVKHRKKQDCSVEKHRLHLVVCTLNQLFRTLLANIKNEYLQNLQKCLSHMTDLHNLFVLLIRQHLSEEQNVVYLRDLVQTNHVFIMIVEEWIAQGYIGEHTGFSMLNHVKQFANKKIMAKYGMLLEHQQLNKETLNVAVLTMMYHVAGDCRRQDTLMQLPILKAFSEIWVDNAVREHEEFKDLIEFVLEVFMNDAEQNPNLCAENLLESQQHQQQEAVRNENKRGHSSIGSGSGDAESSMNISSTCSGEEFTDDEQILMFTWMSELEGSSDIVEVVTKRLCDHGYSKSASQVSRYLSDNGFLDVLSQSPPNSLVSSTTGGKLQNLGDFHENKSIMLELSSLSEDHLIPFLLDKLQALGFDSHLKWLQKQLLEAAYVKLGIKNPSYRINVEEPVSKFYALQNKPIPIIPWNEELEAALSNPYFHLLQQTLGLFTCDDPNIIYPRIPTYLTPTLLVNKARQIGSFETLFVKFDVNTLRDSSELDIEQEEPMHQKMDTYRPMRTLDHMWLNLIQKMNGELEIS